MDEALKSVRNKAIDVIAQREENKLRRKKERHDLQKRARNNMRQGQIETGDTVANELVENI